jgi:hypothetical protein
MGRTYQLVLECHRSTVPSLVAATFVRPSPDTAIASTVWPTVVPALGPGASVPP